MIIKSIPGFSFLKPTIKVSLITSYSNINVIPNRIRRSFNDFFDVNNQSNINIIHNPLLRDIRDNFSIEYINILNFDTNGLILDDNRIIRPFTLNHNFSIEEEQQIIDNNQVNYTVLPDENGWYSDGIFESLFIKTNMEKHYFLKKLYRNLFKNRLT
jgi:hypothetical protein